MYKNILALCVMFFISNLYAEITNGTVTMPTTKSGFIISKDSLVTSFPSQSVPVDVLIQLAGCTLSCPGTCSYTISGCNGIFEFQVPLDSINFNNPIDTLNTAVIKRQDQGILIIAQSMYGKESNPNISFMVKDCLGNFAIFQIVSVETKPQDPHNTGCFGYEVYNITANWVYQPNGSLRFQPPTSIVRNIGHRVSTISNKECFELVPSMFAKVNMPSFDILGRPVKLVNTKSAAMVIQKRSTPISK